MRSVQYKRKGRDLTQSYDKSLYTHRQIHNTKSRFYLLIYFSAYADLEVFEKKGSAAYRDSFQTREGAGLEPPKTAKKKPPWPFRYFSDEKEKDNASS